MRMKHIAVKSSNLHSIGFNPSGRNIQVIFWQQPKGCPTTYSGCEYFDIPEAGSIVASILFDPESAGSAFNRHLRTRSSFRRLTTDEVREITGIAPPVEVPVLPQLEASVAAVMSEIAEDDSRLARTLNEVPA